MNKLLKYTISSTVAILFLSGAAFLYCIYREDRAMDKSGLGNVQQFVYWDNLAELAKNVFEVFLVLLGIGIIISIVMDIKKHF
jgi:hypothetical protein